MHRIPISQAERDFTILVNRVYTEGISIDLERDEKVIARISPVGPQTVLTVRGLNAFLQGLPKLGDDADSFAADVQAGADLPMEGDPWD